MSMGLRTHKRIGRRGAIALLGLLTGMASAALLTAVPPQPETVSPGAI